LKRKVLLASSHLSEAGLESWNDVYWMGTVRRSWRSTYALVPDSDAVEGAPDGGSMEDHSIRRFQRCLKVVKRDGRVLFDVRQEALGGRPVSAPYWERRRETHLYVLRLQLRGIVPVKGLDKVVQVGPHLENALHDAQGDVQVACDLLRLALQGVFLIDNATT
jgi:hypothetical protein